MMYFDIDAVVRREWGALSSSAGSAADDVELNRAIRDVKACWKPGDDARDLLHRHVAWKTLHSSTVSDVHTLMFGKPAAAGLADAIADRTTVGDIASALAEMRI